MALLCSAGSRDLEIAPTAAYKGWCAVRTLQLLNRDREVEGFLSQLLFAPLISLSSRLILQIKRLVRGRSISRAVSACLISYKRLVRGGTLSHSLSTRLIAPYNC